MRITVVTGDAALEATIVRSLTAAGHDVRCVATLAPASMPSEPELLVVHDDAGIVSEQCRVARQLLPTTPIVVVGDGREEADRVLVLDAGADLYLRTPLGERELAAYVRGFERRDVARGVGPAVSVVGDHVRVDRRARTVHRHGEEVHMTPKEYDVLAFLCEDPGAVRRRSEIIEAVWGGEWFGPTKTLDTHIAALRRKLAGDLRITALRGVGFRVDPG